MKFKVIASGSKGNMIYIETNECKVLLDCGITYKNSKLELINDGVNIDDVELILCTHEHTDHVKELLMHMKKTNATLYINEKSYYNLKENTLSQIKDYNIRFIEANKMYKYKDLTIYTLQMSHDSVNCLGFIFNSNDSYLAYMTDTGLIHVDYFPIIRKCHSIIIEANHNIEMLQESSRPIELKRRILSVRGHMSNQITKNILESVLNEDTQRVILAHVSEDCNSDECLNDEIISVLSEKFNCEFIIARQRESLPMMEV